MFQKARHREVSSANDGIRMVFRHFWEVVDCDQLHGLSQEPVELHWQEGDQVDVVHQRVGMRHLSFL